MRFLVFTGSVGISFFIFSIVFAFSVRSSGGEITLASLVFIVPSLMFIAAGLLALGEKLYFADYVPAPHPSERRPDTSQGEIAKNTLKWADEYEREQNDRLSALRAIIKSDPGTGLSIDDDRVSRLSANTSGPEILR